MKIVWSWLLEMCDLDRQPTVEEGARALTRGGIEIEGTENLGAGFSGVVVAEVVGKKPHPNADKLTLVDVITSRDGTPTQVVCGAPNVPEPGRKVLWAQVGAKLPGGLTLAEKPVKGIVSPGMLCAEDELGLGESHAGIIVLDADDATPLGAPAQVALGLDDIVLEVNAPANRGDLLGHLGVARELTAMLGGKVVLPATDLSEYVTGTAPKLDIAIADTTACPRYTARVIEGLKIGPSPRRIASRLKAVGVRPISNLVDVTNYVMFELGQPLHAFDLATLASGTIAVSPANDGEKLKTLDGVERTLASGDIVIRDGEKAIALGGVMGGLDTEVRDATTRVLLEAASFEGRKIRRTASRLQLRSESSSRFERGVDPELADLASRRAARLLCQLGGGKVLGDGRAIDSYPGKPIAPRLEVRLARVRALCGVALDAAACTDALRRLGCEVAGSDPLVVTPPSARADLVREVDVIEEILRVVGYDRVPSTLPVMREVPPLREPDRADRTRQALAAAGASEAITFAFHSVEKSNSLGLPGSDKRAQPIAVRNPMTADQAVMRTSLLPNLLAAVARNASFQRFDVDLFEVGYVFLRRGEGSADRPPNELADEPLWAAGVLTGRRPSGIGAGRAVDVFDAKGRAEVAIRAVAADLAVTAAATSHVAYLHPGIAGELSVGTGVDRRVIGWFGEVHPAVRARLGIEAPVFAWEVELGSLPQAPPAQMTPIPKFPGTSRDVSLLLDAKIPAARVAAVIAESRQPLVTGVRLLEDYRDAKLGASMKSMLWSIGYRAGDRTLTDAEVDKAHEAIVGRLVEDLPAQRR